MDSSTHDSPDRADAAFDTDGSAEHAGSGPRAQHGIALSPGMAAGKALLYRPRQESPPAARAPLGGPSDLARERRRVHEAIASAAAELRELARRTAAEIGDAEAGIFEAQALMLEDPTIAERAGELIEREGYAAEAALGQAAQEQTALLAAMPGPLWQARAADVRDATRRAVVRLRPESDREPSLLELIERAGTPVVIVAEDLAPSDTAQVRADQVVAIALARGSTTAHVAILARALRIPTVGGLGPALFEAAVAGQTLLVDGSQGVVVFQPTAVELEQAQAVGRQQATAAAEARSRAAEWRFRAGRTSDGERIEVLANVGSAAEAQAAAEAGAEGIGLLRSEFLFAQRVTLPDEEEQAQLYAAVISAAGPAAGPITIRTLDVGADKPLPALANFTGALSAEANPALGLRGLRLQLAYPELLATQLRAIVLAAARTGGAVRVLLPMVATLSELRQARAQLKAAQTQLELRGVPSMPALPLGIMVETPAAVLGIAALAREAAFVSIGTNDLAQYVMSADRLNPQLSELCQPLQPPVLHAIAAVARAAERLGRPVAVCGEMAGDPTLALLLVGLGVRELSMSPASIPTVKERLAAYSSAALRTLAARVLQAATLEEARQLLDEQLGSAESQSASQ
jgi:phosphoenolpyruvate-protein phosphotransferase (PTS system enzyme I)